MKVKIFAVYRKYHVSKREKCYGAYTSIEDARARCKELDTVNKTVSDYCILTCHISIDTLIMITQTSRILSCATDKFIIVEGDK